MFLPPAGMASFNRKYLGRSGATDVISFPVGAFPRGRNGAHPLGDIVICLRVVSAYAKKNGMERDEALTRVIIHGVLHLLGYDHDVEKRKRVMQKREAALLQKVGEKRRGVWP